MNTDPRDAAISAVLALHRYDEDWDECYECGRLTMGCDYMEHPPTDWPCPTVKAITEHLESNA